MKKGISIITLILFLFIPIKAYASSTAVEVKIDGKVKKGEEINIVVSMMDLKGLYAASVNFIYDKNILNIIEITPGETIKKHSDEIMEIGGEVDTTNNKTSYSFTFLGDKEGISGNETLAIIKAKVLQDSNLKIGEDSLEVKLVKRVSDTVENYEYKFIEYNMEANNSNMTNKPNNSTLSGDNLINNTNNGSNSDLKNDGNVDGANNINNNNNTGILIASDSNKTKNNTDNNLSDDLGNSSDNEKEEHLTDDNKESKSEQNNVSKSKNNKYLKLIIFSLIILFSLFAVVYYYKYRKVNSKK